MNLVCLWAKKPSSPPKWPMKRDGIIGPDLMRLGLERARNCREAIELMTELLDKYGQAGSPS